MYGKTHVVGGVKSGWVILQSIGENIITIITGTGRSNLGGSDQRRPSFIISSWRGEEHGRRSLERCIALTPTRGDRCMVKHT